MSGPPEDPHRAQRRDIMRRATLYSVGFFAAAIVIAVVGAAFVAWLLTWSGMPFLRTWAIATAVVILPGLLAGIWKLIRER